MAKHPPFKGYNLTEREIRYAMSKTNSNLEAAQFLNISYDTWKKYAKLYKDEETGKNLFELHKNLGLRGKAKTRVGRFKKKEFNEAKEWLQDVLSGKHRAPATWKFKYFLLREGFFQEECMECGFNERRVTDYKVPLLLCFKDGNYKNGHIDNIIFVCYNCYFLTIGNKWGVPQKPKFEIPKDFTWK